MTRNISLDCLKGVAAIFVVFIHAQFPQPYGALVAHIALFAVPVFFMTSGYFSHCANRQKVKKSIIYVLKLICICYVLNLLRLFWSVGFDLHSFKVQLSEHLTLSHLARWLLFNNTTVSGVAWFLFALLYCYILKYIAIEWLSRNRIKCLLLCIFVGCSYAFYRPQTGWTTFGWINCGLPFFLIGDFLNGKQYRIKNSILAILVLCGLILLIMDFYLIIGIWYPAAFTLSISLFLFTLNNPTCFSNRILSKTGSRYAFLIYILHPVVIHLLRAWLPDNCVYPWIFPLYVLVSTYIITFLYYKLKDYCLDLYNHS